MKKLLSLFFVLMSRLSYSNAQTNSAIKFYRENDLYTSFSDSDYKNQYLRIMGANIERDLKSSLILKDSSFIAITGNSVLYPGLEGGYIYKKKQKSFVFLSEKYAPFLKKYTFKIIEGTSDNINTDLPPLQSAAYDYAKKYNILLLKYLSK